MKNIKDYGTIVREKREAKGVTQRQLASAVDISVKTIEEIEKGEHNLILDEILDINWALGIPLSALLDLFDEDEINVLKRLNIIEYCEELGTKKVMDIAKHIKKNSKQ